MTGAVGLAAKLEDSTSLEHAIEDRFGKIRVVKDTSPARERLVRREYDRPASLVSTAMRIR